MACLLPLLLTGLSCGDNPDVYSISIANLKADKDAAIGKLEVRINAGTIQSVQNIPIGWIITIDDDVSWRSVIRGNSQGASATLSPDELQRIALIVRRNETANFKFDVSGTFTEVKTFGNPTKIEATMNDFLLKGVQ